VIPGSASPFFLGSSLATATAGGLQIERSLRFNSSDSAYLSRTPGTAGNRKKFTISFWVKRTALDGGTGPGDHSAFFSAGNWTSDSDMFNMVFLGSGSGAGINVGFYNFGMSTNATFRDLSAWYHFVCAVDTDQAVLNDRIKFYQNGIDLNLAVSASVTQGLSTAVNNTVIQAIGKGSASNFYYLNGYLANFHIIDGQQLTPASFAETDATTGAWNPKTYSGSYGTNGFNLLFADNSSNTASTLGKDTSGLGNNFTPNNLSVTAGAGNDSLVDSPTNYGTDTGVGGEVRGNYATWNPLEKAPLASLTDGNLLLGGTAVGNTGGTIAVSSGKWYWELDVVSVGNERRIGVIKADKVKTDSGDPNTLATGANGYAYCSPYGGFKANSNSNTVTGYTQWDAGNVVAVALDMDNGKVYFARNGTWQESGNPATGTNPAFTGLSGFFTPAFFADNSSTVVATNFGQRAFAYTAPTGFKALNTANLPAPLVTKSNTVFDVKLYTGNGGTQAITGFDFSPDLVWCKGRSFASGFMWFDIIRGGTVSLRSNDTQNEVDLYGKLSSFDSNGFTMIPGTDSGNPSVHNQNGQTYATWCWDAGASTVSNTQGSITSQVRANATAGFSVSTWTGTATAGTVGHGLGVAPEFIIVKNRSVSDAWYCYHKSLGNAARIQLNETSAQTTGSSQWNSTSPTSTVYSVGSGSWHASGNLIVSYNFAPVVGYSSFGSYTGNGSSDGSFVYTGFRPRWVMIKRSDSTSNWFLVDTARDTYNVSGLTLFPNTSDSEQDLRSSSTPLDILSNGFKLRTSTLTGGTNINISSATYIYAAFAEAPFNYSRAR